MIATSDADQPMCLLVLEGSPSDFAMLNFEDLFQSDQSDLKGRTGLDLGPLVSKDLVVRPAGRIWAVSTPGAGTTMSFTLPQARLTPSMVATP